MASLVFVYPEKTRECFGAERWKCSWEKVQLSALRRNRMIEMNAKRKHERDGNHLSEFDKCEVQECLYARLTEINPDSDIDHLRMNFRGADAEKKALDYAKKIVNTGGTAYGVVIVQKQVVDWYVEEDRIAEWQDVGEGTEVLAD